MDSDESFPSRLPPPPFWRTRYFALSVMARADRRYLDPAEIRLVLATPVKKHREPGGRIRH